MRFVLAIGAILVTVFLLVGFFAYAILPGLIERRLAASLKERYGLEKEPAVEVSSGFPPELLLGRIDRIGIRMDGFVNEGIRLRNLRVDLEDVNVSVPSLLRGEPEREIGAGSLRAEVPEESINGYLRENDLGLEGGRIDVHPREVVYRIGDAFLGFPASVRLDLRVLNSHAVEVLPKGASLGGFPLPSFLTRSLASGGRTFELGELPFGAELRSVEPSANDAIVVRAEK